MNIPARYKPTVPPVATVISESRVVSVLGAGLEARLHALIEDFNELPLTVDAGNVEQADTFASHVAKWRRELEVRRKALKEPSLEEGRAIDNAARDADGVAEAMQGVAAAAVISVRETAEAEARAVEARRLRAEAEARERERILADERAKLETGEAADHEALAQLTREHEEAGQAAYLATLDAPVELPKLHVGAAKLTEVEVFDDALVPVLVAGVCVRPVDKPAIRALLKAGVAIPGCRMIPKKGAVVR